MNITKKALFAVCSVLSFLIATSAQGAQAVSDTILPRDEADVSARNDAKQVSFGFPSKISSSDLSNNGLRSEKYVCELESWIEITDSGVLKLLSIFAVYEKNGGFVGYIHYKDSMVDSEGQKQKGLEFVDKKDILGLN